MQEKHGLPALAILAQAALETGWGKHILRVCMNGVWVCSNNIFNIKAGASWKGKRGEREAWEVINGKRVDVKSQWRVYANYEESFDNYAEYIYNCTMKDGTLRYARAISERDSPERYIEEIHAAGYATDPDYSKKIKKIFRDYFCLVE
jgi:flagellar protein FlgJ